MAWRLVRACWNLRTAKAAAENSCTDVLDYLQSKVAEAANTASVPSAVLNMLFSNDDTEGAHAIRKKLQTHCAVPATPSLRPSRPIWIFSYSLKSAHTNSARGALMFDRGRALCWYQVVRTEETASSQGRLPSRWDLHVLNCGGFGHLKGALMELGLTIDTQARIGGNQVLSYKPAFLTPDRERAPGRILYEHRSPEEEDGTRCLAITGNLRLVPVQYEPILLHQLSAAKRVGLKLSAKKCFLGYLSLELLDVY